jgi:hypothetical protein
VKEYADPTGQNPPLTWYHSGYKNTIAAANWAKTQFPSVQKLLVTGYSAGGTATTSAYYFVRRGINPVRGYYLNDSGPVFLAPTATSNSRQLHDKIRESWALDSVFAQLPGTFSTTDFGSINRMVALAFPSDQIAYTGYTRDYNYSRFSYERFLTPNDETSVHAYWKTDQDRYITELSQYTNVSYFVPYKRPINASHCSTVITFMGSHACQKMEKKHYWYEYLETPVNSYKCYSEFVGMDTFLSRFISGNTQVRIVEPTNGYNDEDVGMSIVAPLINGAIGG